MEPKLVVAGIDVGAKKKGFHVVVLADGEYLEGFKSPDAFEIVETCKRLNAQFIGVDAPCRWSSTGRARPAERELMSEGIWCFSTPTRERAVSHPSRNYDWMLAGEQLFQQLEGAYSLFAGTATTPGMRVCFETYPHAVTCSLLKRTTSARTKRTDRREVLQHERLPLGSVKSIDAIDAALCAITGMYLHRNQTKHYGEAETGLIIVPAEPVPGLSGWI